MRRPAWTASSPKAGPNGVHKGWSNYPPYPMGVPFTQVKVCPDCRRDIKGWATQLQQAAPPGVRVNCYIWQQTNFDIDHPAQTPVTSPGEVELVVSASAP
ncbi:MAG: hypothetical protein E6I80_07785 [Chloroflexi bacterium]|nr:MAG: hypothetical protein E6I80_07785 [Chloroflexota bacterium]